jgi:hypothetical protein
VTFGREVTKYEEVGFICVSVDYKALCVAKLSIFWSNVSLSKFMGTLSAR